MRCGDANGRSGAFPPEDVWTPEVRLIYCMVPGRHCVFPYRLKLSGHSASDVPIGTVFPTAFAHVVSLSHALLILRIFHSPTVTDVSG